MSEDLDSLLESLKDLDEEQKLMVGRVVKRQAELLRDWLVTDETGRAQIAIEAQALKTTLLNLGEAKAASASNAIATFLARVLDRGIQAVLT